MWFQLHLVLHLPLCYSVLISLVLQVLKEAEFVYSVDMDVKKILNLEPRTWDFIARLEPKLGVVEYMSKEETPTDLFNILHESKYIHDEVVEKDSCETSNSTFHKVLLSKRPKIVVVGSGPSGLFASLVLGELGAEVTLIERGQPVEQRGRDIGALVVRRILHKESNFCFGEVCSRFIASCLGAGWMFASYSYNFYSNILIISCL